MSASLSPHAISFAQDTAEKYATHLEIMEREELELLTMMLLQMREVDGRGSRPFDSVAVAHFDECAESVLRGVVK